MQGVLPAKASAFAIITRPDGKIYCTLEGPDRLIGVPGGKWDRETDGTNWDDIIAREFLEEVGAPMPESDQHGYVEWGGSSYQIRFKTMKVRWAEANALPVTDRPVTSDPDGSVQGLRWMALKKIMKSGVRPHIRAAFEVMAASEVMRKELYRGAPRRAGEPTMEELEADEEEAVHGDREEKNLG